MSLGRHLSNIYDHRLPDAELMHLYSYDARIRGQEARKAEWQRLLEWINQNVIDRPQATPTYTVEQLEAMGMIGIYAPVKEQPPHSEADREDSRC